MSYAQTVIFAIRAGIRLYGASRKAYADSARGTALALPLPHAPGVEPDAAENWLLTSDEGRRIRAEEARVKWLLERVERSPAEERELVDLYRFYRGRAEPSAFAGADATRDELSAAELHEVLLIRQWAQSEGSGVSPAQTVAGTLVNIAVDYFAETPGAVDDQRPHGKALLAFLGELDRIDFAGVPPREIASGLMVAVLDTVTDYPGLLSGGENEQRLIAGVTRSLSESATTFLDGATDKERRDSAAWLQLVGHAVLQGAAETVLAEPGRYFRVKPGGETELVVEVGRTLTGLLLAEERRVTFRRLLSARGLDQLAKSALSAVARNPDLLGIDNQGLENVVVALAEDVAAHEQVLSASYFPELARLVLDKSADNLDLIWRIDDGDPRRHLLVIASQTLLRSLAAEPPAGATWRPRFTPQQILEVSEAVLDEVVDNPAWLVEGAHASSSHLGAAVDAILAALRQVPQDRISAETGVVVLRVGLDAVAQRLSFLDDLPAAAGEQARPAITAAIDAIFAEVLDDEVGSAASWKLARNSSLQVLTEVALDRLATVGAEARHIAVLRTEIREEIADEGPFDPRDFAERLQASLEAA